MDHNLPSHRQLRLKLSTLTVLAVSESIGSRDRDDDDENHLQPSNLDHFNLNLDFNLDHSSKYNHGMPSPHSPTSPSPLFRIFSFKQPDPPKPDDEGQVIFDDWVIGPKIGQGGFSLVKQAIRTTSPSSSPNNPNQDVRAIKIVKRKVDHTDDETNDLIQLILEHEINIWRHLSHPHIVPLDFVHQDNHATWFFMPYLPGGTLLHLMSRNRKGLGLTRSKKFICQLVSALLYLHEDVRIVHGDIKPENCLLSFHDETADDNNHHDDDDNNNNIGNLPQLLLSDFGMAMWLDTDDEEITSIAPYASLNTTDSTSQAQSYIQAILSQA
ncbi:hypothetical protein KEM54_000763, partial [Ascosphaera aggregata]